MFFEKLKSRISTYLVLCCLMSSMLVPKQAHGLMPVAPDTFYVVVTGIGGTITMVFNTALGSPALIAQYPGAIVPTVTIGGGTYATTYVGSIVSTNGFVSWATLLGYANTLVANYIASLSGAVGATAVGASTTVVLAVGVVATVAVGWALYGLYGVIQNNPGPDGYSTGYWDNFCVLYGFMPGCGADPNAAPPGDPSYGPPPYFVPYNPSPNF